MLRRLFSVQVVFPTVVSLLTITALPASARTPTNDAEAFKRLDLYLDRTAFQGTADHDNVAQYPGFLNSTQLLAIRGPADTVCVIRSQPYDAIDMQITNTVPQSFVEYAISPPRYITSVASILMAYNVFNGSGGFNDAGKTVARVIVHYTDATSVINNVVVGLHVRAWDAGTVLCPGSVPYYTAQPSSPLLGVLWPGGAPNYFYDINEVQLPANKRNVKVDLVRVEAIVQDHFCSTFIPHIYAATRLHGTSLWPNFTVRNASSQPVVRQSQTTGHEHGGYLFGNVVVGQRRTTDVTACKVASLAMAYTYSGFNVSVDSLNAHLQRSRGYQDDQVAIVKFVSPDGSTIRFAATGGTTLAVGDNFLIEHGKYTNPLATYQVTVPYSGTTAGQATRVVTHSATIPSINDPGRVYWNTIPTVADAYTHSPQLKSVTIQTAADVESLLVRDIPVQLNVGPSGGHWVVADGWTSSFRPDGSARGTYSIKDPYDPRNFTKLIEGKYRNTFVAARCVIPTGLLIEGSELTSGDPPGLSVLVSGAYRVDVSDPLGRHMLRDTGSGEDTADIPDAMIENIASEHDNGGDLDAPPTGYIVDMPTTVDGHYTVNVYAANGMSLSASGYNASGVFASDGAVDTTHSGIGGTYDVLYSGAGQSVTVMRTGTIGVGMVPIVPTNLRVRRSPTIGPVEFIISESAPTDDAIDVFDITGRKVDVVQVAGGSGMRTVTWDWRVAGAHPGLYLARLRSHANEITRFVVLQ